MSGTAVPPGVCVTHGWHGGAFCPACSTAVRGPSLTVAEMAKAFAPPPPLPPQELLDVNRAYLVKNGWKENSAGSWVTGNGPTGTWHSLTEAPDVQFRRDGVTS